jgi:hypothetical protein
MGSRCLLFLVLIRSNQRAQVNRSASQTLTSVKCSGGGGCMYSRTVSVQYRSVDGQVQPCPMKWLDNFSMRNFTNDPIFDDTLPVADGLMKIGTRVPLDRLRDAMEDWFRRKSYLAKDASLLVEAIV